MAMFRLPRLKANLAIVNSKGNPLDYFLRFWNIEVAPRIEQQEAGQDQLIQQIQDLQAQQAAQLDLINQALELAGIALETAGGNAGSSSSVNDITDAAWTEGPQVDLTGVVPGDLTVQGTGLQVVMGVTDQNFAPQVGGEIRVVEIDGVTETVVGGPWVFLANKNDASSKTFTIMNGVPSDFSIALTTTGDLSYRLDARMNSFFAMNDVKFYIFVRRVS